MTARLRDLHIAYVSLVPRGADQGANIILTKSAPEETTTMADNVEQAVDRLAKSYADTHPGITPEQAYAALLATDAGRGLYADMTGQRQESPIIKAAPVLKAEFEAEHARIAKASPRLTSAQVYAQALRSPAGQALWAAGLAD